MRKLFKKATAVGENTLETTPLQTEVNVVPKTEITASRQALNNINFALVGESSGESSGIDKSDKRGGCKNKYCCDVRDKQASELLDKCDDESIKDNKNSKTKLIENLRAADNGARADDGSENETVRRPSNDKNSDYIIPPLDYNRLECPDYPFPFYENQNRSFLDNENIKNHRFYLLNCELFAPNIKTKGENDDKSPLDFQFLSNLEKHLDETKFNLLKCKVYNANWRRLKEKFGIEQIPYEDFRDNDVNIEMSDDNRAIKEFYNLTMNEDILVHFYQIAIETGRTEPFPKGFVNFFKWLSLKGKEIKEKHLVKTSWIKAIFKFFAELSE
jgi:hypothetical protein